MIKYIYTYILTQYGSVCEKVDGCDARQKCSYDSQIDKMASALRGIWAPWAAYPSSGKHRSSKPFIALSIETIIWNDIVIYRQNSFDYPNNAHYTVDIGDYAE